jgi:hypothetical protein
VSSSWTGTAGSTLHVYFTSTSSPLSPFPQNQKKKKREPRS